MRLRQSLWAANWLRLTDGVKTAIHREDVNTRRRRYCQEIGVAARKLTARGTPSGPGGAPVVPPTRSRAVHLKHVIVERFQRMNVEVAAAIPGPVLQFPDELGGRSPVEAGLHLRAVALLRQNRPGG